VIKQLPMPLQTVAAQLQFSATPHAVGHGTHA